MLSWLKSFYEEKSPTSSRRFITINTTIVMLVGIAVFFWWCRSEEHYQDMVDHMMVFISVMAGIITAQQVIQVLSVRWGSGFKTEATVTETKGDETKQVTVKEEGQTPN